MAHISVLILEQHGSLLKMFSSMIKKESLDNSFKIKTACSWDQAFFLFKKEDFNLILVDETFIESEGRDVILLVRANCKKARCLFLTLKNDEEMNMEIKKQGFTIIDKSIEDDALLTRIKIITNDVIKRPDFLQKACNEIDSYPYEALLIDENFIIIYLNEQFKKVYGDLIGEPCFKAIGFHSSQCPECQAEAAFVESEGKTIIKSLNTEKGQTRPVKERIQLNYAQPDGRKGFIVTFSEPDADAVMPDPILRQLARIQKIEEQKVMMFAVSAGNLIAYADEGFAAFIEYDLKEITGKPITNFLHSYFAEYLAKEQKAFIDFARESVANTINLDFITKKTKKRKTLICEFRNTMADMMNWEILVISRDAERIKLINKLIEFLQESSSQLLSGNFDMFLALDQERKIQSVNPVLEKKLECKKNEILDKDVGVILDGERDTESLAKAFEQTSALRYVYNLRIDLKYKTRIIPALVNVRAVSDRFNNDIGYVLVMRDIEKDLLMEATLPRIERMQALGELAATTAHQINNYMDGIFKGISLIELDIMMSRMESELKIEMTNHITMIRERTSRLSALTRHLTNYARSQQAPVISLDNVNSVIKDVVDLVKDRVLAKSAVIKTHLSKSVPLIYFSPVHLEQVIMNMVINALDALPPNDGKITISTFTEETWVCISIKDNGCGIPESFKADVFKAFKTTKPPGVGTGLGLKLARDVVTSLNGLIDFESKEGAGTTFIIRLPLSNPGS